MRNVQPGPEAVIRFPDAASRAPRPALPDSEPRGAILLFTGIRYERLSEPSPEPSTPLLSDGQRPGRRRRRS